MLLWLRDMPFSISAGVGFIALFGIAVMNGVVLIEHIRHLRHLAKSQRDAVVNGAHGSTAACVDDGFLRCVGFHPDGNLEQFGAEVQRPLATVVIGGLITSTALTLLVLPTIYGWFEPKEAVPEPFDHKPFEH